MARFEDFYYDSTDGGSKIHALKCLPEEGLQIRGVVQIAHGISEHVERYRPFMEFLAAKGFVSAGNDHCGHGGSVRSENEKGVFPENDGWNKVTADMASLHDIMAEEYKEQISGGAKYIMFGHSMGSFLLRTYMIKYPDKYDMAIISGTGHQNPLLVTAGNVIAKMTVKMKGFDSDGSSLQSLTMGGYLKKIENPKTPFDWLSRDDASVNKYAEDPMCGFTAKAGVYADMLAGIKFVTNQNNISMVPKDKPVYFVSGDQDPVGDYGKGVKKAAECFRKAGIKDVTLKLYEGGRHEMLNEINKDEVMNDISEWLDRRV